MLPTSINNLSNQSSAPQAASSNPSQKQKGTGFTNIGKVLNANQGVGEKLGQKIGGGLSDQANSVREGIQSSQNKFTNQMGTAAGQANNAINAGATYARQAGENDSDYANRVSAGQNVDYSQIGKNLASAAYSGPMGLENANQLNSQASNTAALGRLAGNSAGQSQLLRSQVAQRGNYTTGQNALDSLLLGQGGQKAVQTGRASTNGINQLSNNAILNANNQANVTQSAIDKSKVNAIQGLQNSLTGAGDETSNNILGLNTLAKNQAKDFQDKSSRLGQIVRGEINPSDMTEDDLNLVNSAGDYGIDLGSNLYRKGDDAAGINSALGQLGQVSSDLGSSRYIGNQQNAAQNLAKLLGDTQSQKEIADNKFDSDAFKTKESDALKSMNDQFGYDTETSNLLNSGAGVVKQQEDAVAGQNEQNYNSALSQIQNNANLSDSDKKLASDRALENYNRANAQVRNKGTYSLLRDDIFSPTSGPVSSDQQNVNGILRNMVLNNSVSGGEGGYGNLLYGAAGDNDPNNRIDSRFNNLGLNVQDNVQGNQYRSSQSLLDAAKKAVGSQQSIKDFLMQQYNGAHPSTVKDSDPTNSVLQQLANGQ